MTISRPVFDPFSFWPSDAIHVLREVLESSKTRKQVEDALKNYNNQFQQGCGGDE